MSFTKTGWMLASSDNDDDEDRTEWGKGDDGDWQERKEITRKNEITEEQRERGKQSRDKRMLKVQEKSDLQCERREFIDLHESQTASCQRVADAAPKSAALHSQQRMVLCSVISSSLL